MALPEWVYAISDIPCNEWIVKVGYTSDPAKRIKDAGILSARGAGGRFWNVGHGNGYFWEQTLFRILQKHRISRDNGYSELIDIRSALNGIPRILNEWLPDPDALMWTFEFFHAASTLCSMPIINHYLWLAQQSRAYVEQCFSASDYDNLDGYAATECLKQDLDCHSVGISHRRIISDSKWFGNIPAIAESPYLRHKFASYTLPL